MPIALLKDPAVAAESKVLAGLLISYDGPKGCFPKISSLMADLGTSKHTVIRSLEELERYGFLTREKRGRNNTYHLTPAYVPPARPDDITLTGRLAAENAPAAKPVKRKTLHNRRPDPTLPLALEKVAPEQPIPITRGKRGPKQVALVQPIATGDLAAKGSIGATYIGENQAELVAPEQPGLVALVQPVAKNRLHRSNLDINKNQTISNIQQQQDDAAALSKPDRTTIEGALIAESVAPEDAIPWAIDLVGLNLDDILAALKLLRAKPAYRRREIARPGAYMHTLVNTQVHVERQLAEHEARKIRPASSTLAPRIAPMADVTIVPTPVSAPVGEPHVHTVHAEPDLIPIASQLEALADDVAARVHERALQICKVGSQSPAWSAALAIALRDVQRAGGAP